MPPEDHRSQKKIQCWIPLETWDQIVSLGYTSPTIAVTKAFEKLLEDHCISLKDSQTIPVVSSEIPEKSPEIPILKARTEELEKQIQGLEESLRKAPDISEFLRMQARWEELEKHNQTLKGELEEAKRDKEDLKTIYNNYLLQVQTLINQKAIEAPGEKKKPWYKFW